MIESERQQLYLRTLLIAVLSPAAALMISRAYQPDTLLWDLLRSIGAVFSPAGAVPIEFISIFLLGIYFGLLALFTLDERKRIQGFLLCFGSIISLAVLSSVDILLPNITYTDPLNWGGFILGLVMGSSLGVPKLKERLSADTSQAEFDLTFPSASWTLFSFLAIVLMAGFVGTLLAGTIAPLVDLPVTAGTIYLLFGFVKFTSQSDVAVIGPRESGKSLLLLGLYLSYRERDIAGKAQGYMEDLLSQADSMTPGGDFPIANTYDLEELWFFVTRGGLFPERVKLTVTDHTGELLTRLGEDLASAQGIRDKLEVWKIKYRHLNPLITVTPGGEGNYRLFEQQVRNAEVVVLCIDVARLQNGDVDFVDSLETIGTRAQSNGASVLVVATKCDLLIEDFSPVVENPLDQGLDREFRQEIDQTLRDGYATVDGLCDAVDVDRIYPVYYETTEAEDGRLIPNVDESGALQYQGMETVGDNLLSEL